jgi:hypothetical protein
MNTIRPAKRKERGVRDCGVWCSGVCCVSNYGDPCTQPDFVYECWPFASSVKDAGFAPRRVDLTTIQRERDRVFTTRLRLMQLKAVETNRRIQGGMAAEAKRNCGTKRISRRPIPQRS